MAESTIDDSCASPGAPIPADKATTAIGSYNEEIQDATPFQDVTAINKGISQENKGKAPQYDLSAQTYLTFDTAHEDTEPSLRVSTLPYDVLARMFEEIGIVAATCLSLTCRLLYRYLKVFHRRPIDLRCQPVQDPSNRCKNYINSYDRRISCYFHDRQLSFYLQ
jgi:hypothetical protein